MPHIADREFGFFPQWKATMYGNPPLWPNIPSGGRRSGRCSAPPEWKVGRKRGRGGEMAPKLVYFKCPLQDYLAIFSNMWCNTPFFLPGDQNMKIWKKHHPLSSNKVNKVAVALFKSLNAFLLLDYLFYGWSPGVVLTNEFSNPENLLCLLLTRFFSCSYSYSYSYSCLLCLRTGAVFLLLRFKFTQLSFEQCVLYTSIEDECSCLIFVAAPQNIVLTNQLSHLESLLCLPSSTLKATA